ncbi:MAG: hypothetical protein ABEJ95_03500 [Candidatus Nanohalobium sp.]
MVGFSKGGPEWPSPLKEAGYDLDTIEARIAYQGGKINPDVIFASNSELHTLITECKSGTLSQDTIDEYEKVKSEDLRDVDVYDVSKLTHETIYVGNSNIEESLPHIDTNSAVLVLDDETLKIENAFQDANLNGEFDDLNVSKIPTGYVPFLGDDSEALIAEKMVQEIMSRSISNPEDADLELEIDDLLDDIHGAWGSLHPSEKKTLRNKAKNVLDMMEDRAFEDDIKKVAEADRRYYVSTSNSFQKMCQSLIEDLSGSQQRLSDL